MQSHFFKHKNLTSKLLNRTVTMIVLGSQCSYTGRTSILVILVIDPLNSVTNIYIPHS